MKRDIHYKSKIVDCTVEDIIRMAVGNGDGLLPTVEQCCNLVDAVESKYQNDYSMEDLVGTVYYDWAREVRDEFDLKEVTLCEGCIEDLCEYHPWVVPIDVTVIPDKDSHEGCFNNLKGEKQ
jgi:hypothetical protein